MEVIYLIAQVDRLLAECRRILRHRGKLIIVTANKDLYDFHPSLFSHRYFGTVELGRMLTAHGFRVRLFGDSPLSATGLRQKLTRPAKWLAVQLNVIPRTMEGKKWLKWIIFGELLPMPAELAPDAAACRAPTPIAVDQPDRQHMVLFCVADLHHRNDLDVFDA
jgi:hypothetical protein